MTRINFKLVEQILNFEPFYLFYYSKMKCVVTNQTYNLIIYSKVRYKNYVKNLIYIQRYIFIEALEICICFCRKYLFDYEVSGHKKRELRKDGRCCLEPDTYGSK